MLRNGNFGVSFKSDGAGRVVADINSVAAASTSANEKLGEVGQTATTTGGAFGTMGAAVARALPLAAVVAFATQSVVAFQKIEAQMTTLTGSVEKTRDVMDGLRTLAGQIGSSTNELSQAFVNLTQRGIEPTNERLTAVANIAAQTGRTVEEVSRAYGAAAQGNASVLRQIGVNFAETTDGIVVKFRDGTQQLVREGDSFVGVLDRIGNSEFGGAAAAQADTLAGAFGDLKTAAGEAAVVLLDGPAVALTKILQALTAIVNVVPETSRALRELSEQTRTAFQAESSAIENNAPSFLGAIFGGSNRAPFVARAALTGGFSTGGGNSPSAAATQETQQLSKATEELVAKLLDLTEAEGKSRIETLELAKAKALAKAATDADREAVAKAFDGYIAAAKASEAREKSERATATALQNKAKADREAAAAAEASARATAQQQAALQRLLDQLFDIEPATAAYRDQVAELVALFQAGAIGAEEFNTLLARAQQQLASAGSVPERLTGRPETYADLAQRQVDEYGAVWEDGVSTLGDSLRSIFRQVFGAAGDDIASIFQAVFDRGGNLARTVRSDSAALGRGFETAPDFVGPPTAQGGQAQGGPSAQNIGTAIAQVAIALGPEIGSQIGGNGRNAQLGAQIGQVVGSIFGPIGSLVGSILGGLLGGAFDGTPRITVSGNTRGQERTGRSAFGTFGASTRDTDLPVAQVIEAVTRVDNALASFLTGSERRAASTALRNFSARSSGDDLSIEEVLRQRVATVIQTVEPAFATFLNAIDDVEERIRQFEGLRVLKDQIEDIDRIAAEALGGPLEAQTARISRLSDAVTDAADQLASAIDAQDLAQAAQASQDYQRAILELAQAQIEAATQLEQALIDLDRSARAFDLNLLQRLANLPGGDRGAVTAQLSTNIGVTRANVRGARTPEQALGALNEFIATVDAWLQSATAQVQANLQAQLNALDQERDGILSAAQARADAANAQAQVAAERDRAALDALNEQLRIAQQWVGVLDQADGLIDALRFGSANPIGLQSQFANLGREADTLFGQFNAGTGNRTEIATRLLDILSQQQQVGASLFDRPSEESVALYNQILARITAVRDVALPESERARLLQEQIANLQGQTVAAVNTLTDATYFLTAEERERLDEIEEERRTAEEEAQAALDAINDEAREYYEWARTTGQDLQRQQRDLLQQQLDTLTGGMPVQDFIALKQSEARDALYAIRDDLRRFLDSIRVVGGVVGPGGPGGPGRGGSGGAASAAPSAVNVSTGPITVNVPSGDPAEVANAVRAALRDELPILATALRRELQTA